MFQKIDKASEQWTRGKPMNYFKNWPDIQRGIKIVKITIND